MADADVIVVGGGLAGLVAATEIADAGKRVILLDQEGDQSLGGQAFWSFGGLFLVKFSMVDGDKGKGKKLVMARQFPEPDTQEMPDFTGADTTVLADNLAEVEFAYLGRDNDTTDPTWSDDWKEPARMPEAVRVRFKPLTGQPWPEMVIPLRVVPRGRGPGGRTQ